MFALVLIQCIILMRQVYQQQLQLMQTQVVIQTLPQDIIDKEYHTDIGMVQALHNQVLVNLIKWF